MGERALCLFRSIIGYENYFTLHSFNKDGNCKLTRQIPVGCLWLASRKRAASRRRRECSAIRPALCPGMGEKQHPPFRRQSEQRHGHGRISRRRIHHAPSRVVRRAKRPSAVPESHLAKSRLASRPPPGTAERDIAGVPPDPERVHDPASAPAPVQPTHRRKCIPGRQIPVRQLHVRAGGGWALRAPTRRPDVDRRTIPPRRGNNGRPQRQRRRPVHLPQ